MVRVAFKDGTLIVDGPPDAMDLLSAWCLEDPRIGCWRAEARFYAPIILSLHREGVPFEDTARAYEPTDLPLQQSHPPRDYQRDALDAWIAEERRGVVVLPTGSGKSLVADLAISTTRRPALVVVPTLDLMAQWVNRLERAFGIPVGMLGGGNRELHDITVSTYDSAVLTVEFFGNRFGLLVIDECHHLPSAVNQQLARGSIAPFRLGLTATPEREDGGDDLLAMLLGPVCYRRDIDELEGHVLSPYRTVRVPLPLDPDEAQQYEEARQIYVSFVRQQGIRFSSPDGWNRFLTLSARSAEGRAAFEAYLKQKQIARSGRAKIRALWDLIRRHAGERMLVFTADNGTAYELGRRFFLPVLTHQTAVAERREFLDAFRRGDYPVLVTSKVLNEGVDVPEASVGVVVSGSGSTREHVQRLGRILRPAAGKNAVLYELISLGTSESYVSERRRQHRAYQRPHSVSQ
jgi:superfamily II DNA or RNA helicase